MSPMPTATAQLASMALGRPVGEWARAERDAGKSWRRLSLDLRDVGVDVTAETLRMWTQSLNAGLPS